MQQAAQAPQPVADRRGRQVQPRSGTARVAFGHDRLEQDEKVQVGPGKISLMQHIPEIISLDS